VTQEISGGMLEAESPSELNVGTPVAPAPSTGDDAEDQRDTAAKVIGEFGDYADYKREREDQEAQKDGQPDGVDRRQARHERWQRTYDKVARATAHAMGQESNAFADALEMERAATNANIRAELHSQSNPDFAERTAEVAAEYGTLQGAAARVIGASPAVSEISELICDNPEFIEQLNRMSRQELAVLTARWEGQLHGVRHQQQQFAPQPPMQSRRVSNAPPPVTTLSGRGHGAVKAADEMNYDQYKAWRMSGGGKDQ
jgi:hypothetical protein